MNSAVAAKRVLVSQLLAEDADMRDIVEEFVAGLDARVAELRAAYDRLDWDNLAMFAHRLKGAGGSYGYPDIGRIGAALEADFRVRRGDNFGAAIAELDELVRAARAGLSVR
ncbi:Hpt domain protein [Phycisphaerae bacterium RAS1]|nr:Hpt domain protein [Phycisphaerae bacterium RAS1]